MGETGTDALFQDAVPVPMFFYPYVFHSSESAAIFNLVKILYQSRDRMIDCRF
ncbi:MAG: hypothetical protein H6Q68_3756 [Firmicutes bacterium]|nr:hypothetical protein [Bacillota bacterium]